MAAAPDRFYQGVQVAGDFRCGGACKVGIMLRSEKTADSIKGLYGVLAGADRGVQAASSMHRGG